MSKLKEIIHQYVVEALEEILSEGEAPTYDVVHPKHGIIGTHNAQTGFKPSKPHLGYKSGKTVPNGASIKRNGASINRRNPDTVEIKPKAKQISEARKLIKHYKSPEADMEAKVYKNPETGEHEVDFYKNGKNLGEGPRYYTDSLEDAHTTAQTGLKRMQKRHPVEEGVRRERRIGTALAKAALKGGNDPTNISNRDALKAALETEVTGNVRSRVKRMRERLFTTPES